MTRRKMPSPAMIMATAAMAVALSGTAVAASIGIGDLGKKAKKQVVGAGPLEYVTTTTAVGPSGPFGTNVAAYCPANTFPVGGGIKLSNDAVMIVNDDYPIQNGWTGTVFNGGSLVHFASVTVACAKSRDVEGVAPLFSAKAEDHEQGVNDSVKKD